MKLDDCPKGCKHATFHYCIHGTHCDRHCVCPCHLCVADKRSPANDTRTLKVS